MKGIEKFLVARFDPEMRLEVTMASVACDWRRIEKRFSDSGMYVQFGGGS